MGKPHGQRVFIGFHRSGEKFSLAITFLLLLLRKTGNKIVTRFKKSDFFMVSVLLPLYLIVVGGTGNNSDTELNILPSI